MTNEQKNQGVPNGTKWLENWSNTFYLPPPKKDDHMISLEDNLKRSQLHSKRTSQEDNLTGRQPHRKTTSQEDTFT